MSRTLFFLAFPGSIVTLVTVVIMLGKHDTYEEFKRKQIVEDLDQQSEALKLYLSKVDIRVDPRGSEIVQFLTGKNVFVTGGTGFLGKSMVEKLLRSCQGIGGVFLLVRAKKGVNVEERLVETLKDPLFFPLMELDPGFRGKIRVFQGDVALPKLGLSDEDRRFLVDNIDVIVHIAATTKFDEKIRLATAINVVGTMEVLDLALDCKKLKVFTHVSTAYSQCPRKKIDEVFYEPPMEPKDLVSMVQGLSDEALENNLKGLLGDFPNTYTFTKAVAEEVVRVHSKKLKICMIRPSIVISTYREPLRGWIDNLYGIIGAMAAAAAGFLRVFYVDKNIRAEMVPCDYVTNATIAATFRRSTEPSQEVQIYNFVSDRENFGKVEDIVSVVHKECTDMVPLRTLWYVYYVFVKSYYGYRVLTFLLHTIPAYIFDIFLALSGQKIRLTPLYKKLHKFLEVVNYFVNQNWNHSNVNTQKLWTSLRKEDQNGFPFDMSEINLRDFFIIAAGGTRTFIVKEPWSNLKEAKKRMRKMHFLHIILQIFLASIFIGILYLIFL